MYLRVGGRQQSLAVTVELTFNSDKKISAALDGPPRYQPVRSARGFDVSTPHKTSWRHQRDAIFLRPRATHPRPRDAPNDSSAATTPRTTMGHPSLIRPITRNPNLSTPPSTGRIPCRGTDRAPIVARRERTAKEQNRIHRDV